MKLILNQYVISICVQNLFYSCEKLPCIKPKYKNSINYITKVKNRIQGKIEQNRDMLYF